MDYKEEYFCPNCGATLNDQYGFDPDKGTWKCASCGKTLVDDDIYEGENYEGVAWFCDDCGALLNRQNGFTDNEDTWTCTKCGCENDINNTAIKGNRNTANTIGHCLGEAIYTFFERRSQAKRKQEEIKRRNRKKLIKERLPIILYIILGIVLTIMLICIPACLTKRTKEKAEAEKNLALGKIQVAFSSDDLIGENWYTVEEELRAVGFTVFEFVDLDDHGFLGLKEDDVDSISIGGDNEFSSSDRFFPEDKIIITFR